MTRALVALDVDRTLVHGAGSAPGLRVVEHLDGKPLSAMTPRALEVLGRLAGRHEVVPVTTRTVEQWQRVQLPALGRYAVCGNGGVLLVDGRRDEAWAAWAREVCAQAAPLAEAEALVADLAAAPWVRTVRTAEQLFVYVVAHSRDAVPAGWVEALSRDAGQRGWTVSVQGRKTYLVPAGLTKGAAAQRLARDLGCAVLAAAGDSVLDQPLLEVADLAVRPAHGELHELGWSLPGLHVTAASGAAAGEELLDWLDDRLAG